ncbi:MAG TPA: cytochrome c oxidase assembly protein [Longimicrobium sp.]|jgi:putative membrane protein|uniref:cytochrome c oxidase assembly protein n=1 Tax=Longimicrobium sp. TaxID=2029185 RepID=UPI002EDB7943
MQSAVLGLALLHGGETFSWSEWKVYPSFMAGWLLMAGAYFLAIGPLRHRFAGSSPVPGRKVASFAFGLVMMFASLQGPLHELSDYFLFSAHMVQHLVLILMMPPFLLYGTPDWLLRPLVRRTWGRRIARALTFPLVAFALNNIIFLAWHFPGPYDLMMRNHNVHITMHLMIMVTGTIMWWPVMSPLPELPRVAPVLQMVYLFLVGIPMMVSAALITFSQSELYSWYVEAPRLIPALSALEDQRLGGVIMWVPGGLTLWLAITAVYFRWTNRERREDEAVTLAQPRVNRSGLVVTAPPPFPGG